MDTQAQSSADINESQARKNIQTSQLLTFIMENEEYGVDILSVVEIRGWEPATPLPTSPSYVQGVINLRGTIVPVVDLRQKFNMSDITCGPSTVVVVLKVENEGKEKIMGIVVDAVSDVYTIQDLDINDAPAVGGTIGQEYLQGLVTIEHEGKQKMVIILDVNNLLYIQDELNLDSIEG